MSRLAKIRAESTFSDLIEGQPQHVVFVALMWLGACSLMVSSEATLWGMTATTWAMLSIAIVVVHQFMVAAVFRLQLHHNLLTKYFGDRDMRIWAFFFLPFLAARPLTVLMVGLADTVPITENPKIEWIVGGLLLIPAAWAMHSTLYYFTLPRALGGDHFRDRYADMPLVRVGAFRYTSNAMYGIVFLGLWAIALICNSWNAMVVALFQHAYIWVHMYCTEQPDMRWIYGRG